jgi:hypothetical protein
MKRIENTNIADFECLLACWRYIERNPVRADDIKHIRSETNRGTVVGSDRFKDKIESVLTRRARPGQSGRPNKKQEK